MRQSSASFWFVWPRARTLAEQTDQNSAVFCDGIAAGTAQKSRSNSNGHSGLPPLGTMSLTQAEIPVKSIT
jgi:hypothetical protein